MVNERQVSYIKLKFFVSKLIGWNTVFVVFRFSALSALFILTFAC